MGVYIACDFGISVLDEYSVSVHVFKSVGSFRERYEREKKVPKPLEPSDAGWQI